MDEGYWYCGPCGVGRYSPTPEIAKQRKAAHDLKRHGVDAEGRKIVSGNPAGRDD